MSSLILYTTIPCIKRTLMTVILLIGLCCPGMAQTNGNHVENYSQVQKVLLDSSGYGVYTISLNQPIDRSISLLVLKDTTHPLAGANIMHKRRMKKIIYSHFDKTLADRIWLYFLTERGFEFIEGYF